MWPSVKQVLSRSNRKASDNSLMKQRPSIIHAVSMDQIPVSNGFYNRNHRMVRSNSVEVQNNTYTDTLYCNTMVSVMNVTGQKLYYYCIDEDSISHLLTSTQLAE